MRVGSADLDLNLRRWADLTLKKSIGMSAERVCRGFLNGISHQSPVLVEGTVGAGVHYTDCAS